MKYYDKTSISIQFACVVMGLLCISGGSYHCQVIITENALFKFFNC